jgi:putative ABC transport system permease protein
MFRLAVKSIRQKPGRMILTAIAVALGVALVAATFTFTSSLRSGFTGLFTSIYSSTDVIVEADPNSTIQQGGPFQPGDPIFSTADVAAVQAVDGVDVAAGSLQVQATVLPKDPEAKPGFGGGGTQMFNWIGDPRLDLSTIVDGRGVESDDEIVLDVDSVTKYGYALGDSVRVSTDKGIEEFTLVGTARFGDDNNLQGATLAYVSQATAMRIVDTEDFSTINVIANEGVDKDALAADIAKVIPDGTRAITGEEKTKEQISELDTFLDYINVFAVAFALISLFVGAYIIVNTFRIIVTQRTREFGLLRAIGATGRQVRSTILLEAVLVGLIASSLGIGLGYLLALGAVGLVSVIGADVFGSIGLPLTAIGWSYCLGMLVTVGSALAPAIHASGISPMEALREAATDSRKPLRRRNVVGIALTLLGIVGVAMGLYASLAKPYIYVGVGAVLLVLGVTLLAAQVLVPIAFGLRGALTALFKVDGKLAANNIKREPRRSSNTAAAVMIGVMLLALSATFTESLKSMVTAQFSQIKADFFVVDATGAVPQGALDLIQNTDGVDFISSVGIGTVEYKGSQYQLAVVDPETAVKVYDYNTEPDFTALGDGVFVDPVIAALGVSPGDTVDLTGPAGEATLTVTGQYKDEGDANFFVDWATGETLLGDVPVSQSQVMLKDGADVDAVKKTLEDELSAQYPTVLLQSPDDLAKLVSQGIDMILGFISALLLAALLIALLGVANTLLLSVTERTREIGLLRAVGVKRSSVWRMITIESMVMAIFGTILGMILGVGLGSALVLSLGDYGFDRVAIPWVWLVIYTVLAAIAGVLAAILPAWRASRLDILQAIASDG